MSAPIEDYALIGDMFTAGLVSRAGSIDWLCMPRFDSRACFAALLGDETHGRWLLRPADPDARVSRRYRDRTLILETTFECRDGTVRIVDCMSPRHRAPDVVRIVEGVRGRVEMRCELSPRFDYGSLLPWVQRTDRGAALVAGPDALELACGVDLDFSASSVSASFSVGEGQREAFVLNWHTSYEPPPDATPADRILDSTERWWHEWTSRCAYEGEYEDEVIRSLITLKALTYAPSGGILAAATTSLPELIGGSKNWDYRFCWVRDATFTLDALLVGGYVEEAVQWRDWLLRAVAGDPARLNLMYGVDGERRLPEIILDWLPGYEGSRPVRVGNAASDQFQLDVYGELMDAVYDAREQGMEPDARAWEVQAALLDFLESNWREPDNGIWEFRDQRRHYTHSKVMAWVAFDRAIRSVEKHRLEGPVGRWRECRDDLHAQVLAKGWNPDVGAFTQSYGSEILDASVLMMSLVGFLPATDRRVQSTVEAIQRELGWNGFLRRFPAEDPPGSVVPRAEGAFLACSFWLADNLILMGRTEEARETFDRVVGVANDVGLLAEEYDPDARRQLGNFPQAFSHVGIVNTARSLSRPGGPSERREKKQH